MRNAAARLGKFPQSVINEVIRLAGEVGAINLASGRPDFDPPPELKEALQRASSQGHHQYANPWGALAFRTALAQKQARFMGLELDPVDHITVTCGSTEAMMIAMMALCDPGDRVIVFSPFYENYAPTAIMAGAEPIYVQLRPPEYALVEGDLRDAFESRPKVIVLCNPSNPTGRVFTLAELEVIAELAQEFDTYVIADEAYEHIVYPPHRHTYFASLPGMFPRTISCGSLSKTYHITGWRLGYLIASLGVTEQLRKVHDYTTIVAPSPLQEAAVVALEFPDSYYEQLVSDYASRRERFLGYLEESGMQFTRPEGAFYVMADISSFGFPDDTAFCRWMIKEIGLAAVPGSSFFSEPVDHLIRLHFAKRDETLTEVGERLRRLAERR